MNPSSTSDGGEPDSLADYNKDELLTIEQIAATLRVTYRTARKYVVNGDIKSYKDKMSKQYYIKPEDFRQWRIGSAQVHIPTGKRIK